VAHHVYEEEGEWFLDLRERASEPQQSELTQRYAEEFERYVGEDGGLPHTRQLAAAAR
jgi:hypothetical protein